MTNARPLLYSVSELNLLAKNVLENSPQLNFVEVKGEIASYKRYPSGDYFDIKDEKSYLSCVIWARDAAKMSFVPKVGDEVVLFGSVSLYAQKGRYQFTAFSLSLFGKGEALLALEQLKEKLSKEGLFDISKKKAIPQYPNKISIVVGKDSAAEADLIANISRRWPLAEVVIHNALVQGKNAPEDIIRALNETKEDNADVLILSRGGGSNDDLSAFNDEELVRAFYAIDTPKIAAVGHEIDFTLVDYVADKRVSTPTAAAELATPNKDDVYDLLSAYEKSLFSGIMQKIESKEALYSALLGKMNILSPKKKYDDSEEKLESFKKRLSLAINNLLKAKESQMELTSSKLNGLDHHKVLNRGYSIAYDKEGKILSSIKEIKEGEEMVTLLKDGKITSKIIKGEENGK